jgi:hypothetical protein
MRTVHSVQTSQALYGTRRFITVFTRARHRSISWARQIQSITSNPISWKPTLILSSLPRLRLPGSLFPSEIMYSHLPHARYMPRPSHLPWFDHFNYWRRVQIIKLIKATTMEIINFKINYAPAPWSSTANKTVSHGEHWRHREAIQACSPNSLVFIPHAFLPCFYSHFIHCCIDPRGFSVLQTWKQPLSALPSNPKHSVNKVWRGRLQSAWWRVKWMWASSLHKVLTIRRVSSPEVW